MGSTSTPTLQCFQVSANTRFVDTASPKGLDSAIRARWFRLEWVYTIDKGKKISLALMHTLGEETI